MIKIVVKKRFILASLFILILAASAASILIGVPTETTLYWYILVFWAFAFWVLGFASIYSLSIGLIIFSIAVVIYLCSFTDIAEIFMRTAFIGFIVGIPKAFIEYIFLKKPPRKYK